MSRSPEGRRPSTTIDLRAREARRWEWGRRPSCWRHRRDLGLKTLNSNWIKRKSTANIGKYVFSIVFASILDFPATSRSKTDDWIWSMDIEMGERWKYRENHEQPVDDEGLQGFPQIFGQGQKIHLEFLIVVDCVCLIFPPNYFHKPNEMINDISWHIHQELVIGNIT